MQLKLNLTSAIWMQKPKTRNCYVIMTLILDLTTNESFCIDCVNLGKQWTVGVHKHRTYTAAVQVDSSFSRTKDPHPHVDIILSTGGSCLRPQDPHPDVPCERWRARFARVLSRDWTCRLRVVRLPRRTTAAACRQSSRRHQLYVYSTRTVVGDRYHDDGRLRRLGSTHLSRDAGRVCVCSTRSTDAQSARADHC